MIPALLIGAALGASAPQAVADVYDQAVAARRAGDAQRAASLLEPFVAAHPDNADARLQLGLAYLALGRLDQAEAAFRQVLAIAPGYDDARIGLAWVAQHRGDATAARQEIDRVGDQSRPEVTALRTQLAAADAATRAGRWRLDLDGVYSAVHGRSDWIDGTARLGRKLGDATTVTGGIEAARRFGRSDVLGELQVDHRFAPGIDGYVAVAVTPRADFLPEWRVAAGGSARLWSGPFATVLTLDLRQAHYAIGDIQTVDPGVTQYFAKGNAWITARMINTFDENGRHRAGYSIRGDVMADEALRLFAGFADAPDTSEGFVVNVASLFGGISYGINDKVTVRGTINRENREFGPDRLEFGLGTSIGF